MSSFTVKLILLLGTFLALSVIARAQTTVASAPTVVKEVAAKGNDVLAHARDLYSTAGPKIALPEFEKALELFRNENDKKGEAITLGLMGNCYKKFGDFSKAESFLQRALAMKRAIGDRTEEAKTLSHLGLLLWEMADYQQATEYFHQAIAIAEQLQDWVIEASARNNLGLVLDEIGDYRKSLEQYNRALELYRFAQTQLGASPTIERGMSDTIGNIGGDYLLLGDFSKALAFYQQALEIDERNKLKVGIVLDLQNIGLANTGLGRITEALTAFERSIRLASEAGLKKEEADSRKGRGSALLQLGKYDDALAEYRQGLQVYEVAGLKQNLVEGLTDFGNLELRLGDSASAEKDFQRALDISNSINHPRGVTYNLIALGDLKWRRKRYSEASALYKDALARATEAKDQTAIASAHLQLALTDLQLKRLEDAAQHAKIALDVSRSMQARSVEAAALYAQAEISRAAGQLEEALKQLAAIEEIVRQTHDPELTWRLEFQRGQTLEALNRNDEALVAYQKAVKTIEQVRSELREERFRAGYIDDKYQVYVALVQLLLKLGKPNEAFILAERLRARSYLDLFNRGQPPMRSDAQRQKEAGLRNRIRELQRQVEEEAKKPGPDRRREAADLFSKELQTAEREYENFLDDLASTDRDYADVRALRVPSIEEVKRKLSAGTALIEYVVAEDSLDIFVLTPHALYARSVPVRRTELQSKVEFLRDVLLRNNTDEWKLPATSLYRTLVAPVEDAGWLRGINRLYIVPHADLHYLPFAVLSRGGKGGERLLVDDYVLAYLPAAAALVHSSQKGAGGNSVLAMAPSSTRLRYAQRESQDVSAFFPKQKMLLLGARATEASFKRFADRFDVIHLATHGYFNKLNPLLSGVALEPDAQDDGRLEVHEILNLRLNAKLVTLSACNTALGSGYFAEIPSGDDIVGLTRAFLFAGSPTVMASLWEVDDFSAVRLMRGFYSQLAHTDKATALARAQREMRRRGGVYGHPYYWSTFILAGQMQ